MTERWEFLHLTSQTRDVFQKQWELKSKKIIQKEEKGKNNMKEEQGKNNKKGEQGKGNKMVEQGKIIMKVMGKENEEGQGKSSMKEVQGKENEEDQGKDKKRSPEGQPLEKASHSKKSKTLLDLLFSKAIQSKNLYLKVTGQTAALLDQVGSDEQFGWVNEALLGPVHTAQNAVAKQVDQFTLMMLSGTSMNVIRQQFHDKEQELEDKLRKVCLIDPFLNMLRREVGIIMKMRAARSSA